MKPGVASAWTANSAVIVENAMPIRTLRPSRARAPAMLSASDARLAIAAAALTRPKCTARGHHEVLVPDGGDDDDRRERREQRESEDDPCPGHCPVYRPRTRQKLSAAKVVLTNS